jgi:hypothetical protein
MKSSPESRRASTHGRAPLVPIGSPITAGVRPTAVCSTPLCSALSEGALASVAGLPCGTFSVFSAGFCEASSKPGFTVKSALSGDANIKESATTTLFNWMTGSLTRMVYRSLHTTRGELNCGRNGLSSVPKQSPHKYAIPIHAVQPRLV